MKRQIRLALALLGIAAAAFAAAAPEVGAAPQVATGQNVVTIFDDHHVFSAPGGNKLGIVAHLRPITGEATTLPVLSERKGTGGTWLLVRLPGRPNSHVGWIRYVHARLSVLYWHIVVSLGQRTAYVFHLGKLDRVFRVVVGKPSTPTPQGHFFIEESIAEPANFPGAPFALATSARSNVYTEFDGGPGQIALHGIGGGLGGDLGTAESHGCIRFGTRAITYLANRIYPGTPLDITG